MWWILSEVINTIYFLHLSECSEDVYWMQGDPRVILVTLEGEGSWVAVCLSALTK